MIGVVAWKSEKLVQVFEAMLSARNCNLTKISGLLQTKNRPESDYRGIQRFFAGTQLCEKECAKLIWSALGIEENEKVILILDRTYWMKGKTHLNFLYLSVFYKGYGTPVFFKILPDKKGHSSVADRKELLNKFIDEFGKERIHYVVADREFDGNEWLSHLKDSKIGYVQRLKENIICISNSRGEMVSAKDLCHHIGIGEKESFGKRRIYKSHNLHTNITVTRSSKGKVVMLAHSEGIDDPTYAYGFRWGIEVGFRAMKTGGFNIEDTGLTHPKRITTLYRIIAILTALSYKGGMLIEDMLPIKIRSHGRKSISYIKLFLDFIASCKHKALPAFKPIIRRLRTTPQLPFLFFCRVR